MPRSYSVATAAFAVDASIRWVDNLLARYDLPGVRRAGRGIALEISHEGLRALALTRLLVVALGLGLGPAAALAARLCAGADAKRGELELAPLVLSVDLAAIERGLAARLLEAAEALPRTRRGRPPGRRAVSS